jgi:transcriptional regulator with XRE-family HTH domain
MARTRLGSPPLAELAAKQRKQLSLSLEEAAQRVQGAAEADGDYCAFTRQTIYEIERGRIPHPRNLRWLATGLGLPVEQITQAAQQQRLLLRHQFLHTSGAGALLVPTSAGRQGSAQGAEGPVGTITGAVLTLARRSAGLSLEAFAHLLHVPLEVVQGWETGHRPLVPAHGPSVVEVRQELAAADADLHLLTTLDPAMTADWIIDRTLEPDGRAHPLAMWVTTRRVHDLLVWALGGRRPEWLPHPDPNGQPATLDSPALDAAERRAVFARLRDLAERADGRREEGLQLRRQAAYLAGYDPAADTDAWLDHPPKASPSSGGWSPGWVAARSRAVTIAARGDPEPLRWFIDHALVGDDRLEAAQLAWNAHYYEEFAAPFHSDSFMVADDLPAWRGERLLAWLTGRLDPKCGYVDLMAHTLWALLASRHLAASPAARGLAERTELLAATEVVSARSRRELGEVVYLLRALDPTKGPR